MKRSKCGVIAGAFAFTLTIVRPTMAAEFDAKGAAQPIAILMLEESVTEVFRKCMAAAPRTRSDDEIALAKWNGRNRLYIVESRKYRQWYRGEVRYENMPDVNVAFTASFEETLAETRNRITAPLWRLFDAAQRAGKIEAECLNFDEGAEFGKSDVAKILPEAVAYLNGRSPLIQLQPSTPLPQDPRKVEHDPSTFIESQGSVNTAVSMDSLRGLLSNTADAP